MQEALAASEEALPFMLTSGWLGSGGGGGGARKALSVSGKERFLVKSMTGTLVVSLFPRPSKRFGSLQRRQALSFGLRW